MGAFPLHEELVKALATEGATALVELTVVSMPASRWTIECDAEPLNSERRCRSPGNAPWRLRGPAFRQ